MIRKLLTKVLALTTGAVLLAGVFSISAFSPSITVRAADAHVSQLIAQDFDAAFYAKQYPDVKAAVGTNPKALLAHFTKYGMKEGRMMNANFDPKAYCDAYPDIKAYCKGDYTKAYEHYEAYGQKEGRTITTYAKLRPKTVAPVVVVQPEKTTTRRIDIGHGLIVDLSENQYNYCEIAVKTNDQGFAAYLGDTRLATYGDYGDDGAYTYSTIIVNNGHLNETIYGRQVKKVITPAPTVVQPNPQPVVVGEPDDKDDDYDWDWLWDDDDDNDDWDWIIINDDGPEDEDSDGGATSDGDESKWNDDSEIENG